MNNQYSIQAQSTIQTSPPVLVLLSLLNQAVAKLLLVRIIFEDASSKTDEKETKEQIFGRKKRRPPALCWLPPDLRRPY